MTRTQVLPNDLVGINAFGFGGTNGHVLLRKYKKEKATVTKDDLPRLVGVSGRTELAVTHFLDKVGTCMLLTKELLIHLSSADFYVQYFVVVRLYISTS